MTRLFIHPTPRQSSLPLLKVSINSVRGREDESGNRYTLNDPREVEIRTALCGCNHKPMRIVNAFQGLPALFPKRLSESPVWEKEVTLCLDAILSLGMRRAIILEAKG